MNNGGEGGDRQGLVGRLLEERAVRGDLGVLLVKGYVCVCVCERESVLGVVDGESDSLVERNSKK